MSHFTNKLRLYLEFEWDLKVGWQGWRVEQLPSARQLIEVQQAALLHA